MSSINFDNVYLLLIAIPLLVLFTVPFAIAVRKENRNGHNVASMVMHVAMAVLIAFSAAGTTVVSVLTETQVYVVADVSYSAEQNLDKIDESIGKLKNNLPRNSKLGTVCFAKDYEVLFAPGERVKSVKDSGVDISETNIKEALEYTGTLFKADAIKRIVLITDGLASDLRDDNALKRTVDTLKSRGVRVDAIYLDDNLPEGAKEVQVSGVDFTRSTYLNHEEKAVAYVRSSYSVYAYVSLYRNGVQAKREPVQLAAGNNGVTFHLNTTEAGDIDYEVRVEAEGDGYAGNNAFAFTQTVSDTVNVLLITDSPKDKEAAERLFGEKATIDSYVATAKVPDTVEELCRYDEIMLSNVDVRNFSHTERFVESLDQAVSFFGKSLVTFGNTFIQNNTDETLKKLEDMLPVRFGNNAQAPKMYTIVIDISRSMAFNYHLIVAKQAARNLLSFLQDDDYVSIVAFSGNSELPVPPQKVGENRGKIEEAINRLSVNQGTVIGAGLKMALKWTNDSRFREKQVMLISDGLDYVGAGASDGDPLTIVRQMKANNIVTSVLDVGRGGRDFSDPVAQNAKSLLESLAAVSGDKDAHYFYAATPEELDGVMFGEIADDLTKTEIDAPAFVSAQRRNDAVLKDISSDDLFDNYVGGFYANSPKASANTVLVAKYVPDATQSDVSADVPIYAYWGYGNGKVASFTSKLTGGGSNMPEWMDKWNKAGMMETFMNNVFETNLPAVKTDVPYTVNVSTQGKFARIEITPAVLHAGAKATVKVTVPGAEEIEDTFVYDAEGYFYEFALPATGEYKITTVYSYGGSDYAASADFKVSYLAEYDRFAIYDVSVLHKMVGGDGEVSTDGNLIIENDEKELGIYRFNLTVPLLIAAVVLWVADVVVRKLKWNDIKSLFVKVKK